MNRRIFGRFLVLGLTSAFAVACSSPAPVADDGMVDGESPTLDGDTTPNDLTDDFASMSAESDSPFTVDAADAVCPTDTNFDSATGFCVTSYGEAEGPFPAGMVAACKAAGHGAVCDSAEWPLAIAVAARNTKAVDDPTIDGDGATSLCPTGTAIDPKRGLCSDGTYVYGPFDTATVEECQASGGAAECTTLRFPVKFATTLITDFASVNLGADGQELESLGFGGELELAKVPNSLPAACGQAAKLFNFYNNRQNFSQIRRRARAIEASGKRCATYVSLAIQGSFDSKFPMRKRTDSVNSGGNGVREELFKRGWKPVSASRCQPGDIAFTQDLNEYGKSKKYPKIRTAADAYRKDAHSGHVYMVADNQNGVLTAIDNRITDGAYGSGKITNSRAGKTATAYCLRAPDAEQGCASGGTDVPASFCSSRSDGFYCSPSSSIAAIQCTDGARGVGLQCGTGLRCVTGSDGKAALSSPTSLACR